MKFKQYALVGLAVAMASSAFASGIGNTYNQPSANASTGPINNAPVANGGTGIGLGGAATAINGPNTNTNTALGGAGGQGGQGGRGGEGGSVIGSGNSSNTNTNANLQGQVQQATGGTSSAGASAGSSSTSASNASNGNMIGGTQAQDNRVDNRVNVEGDTNNYEAQARNPVSTAYAPNVAPTALCALGVSGGAQGVSFGLSFGKAYIDDNCQLLEQVRATATVLGDRATAAEMMCDVPSYKAARERTGKPCGRALVGLTAPAPSATVAPRQAAPVAPAAPVPAPAVRQPRNDRSAATGNDAYAANQRGESVDPIVRARLGLPPLN